MQEVHLTRQSDLIPADTLDRKIVVIGAGAIGSFATLALAKMGFKNITVYDGDVIDPENMNCQFYPMEAIGQKKTSALLKMIDSFAGIFIDAKDGYYSHDLEGTLRDCIVISAVDSMRVRKHVFESCAPSVHLIDGRMAAEYAMLLTVDMSNAAEVSKYADTLYSDEEASHERCTAKSTMYTVNLIAGLIGKAVKDIVTDKQTITSLDWNVAENSAVWFSGSNKLTM